MNTGSTVSTGDIPHESLIGGSPEERLLFYYMPLILNKGRSSKLLPRLEQYCGTVTAELYINHGTDDRKLINLVALGCRCRTNRQR